MKKNITIFNNGILTEDGMSGSDNRALNWSEIWSENHNVILVSPLGGERRYSRIQAEKIFTNRKVLLSPSPWRALWEYIFCTFRAIRATCKPLKNDHVIYSSSDLFPDSIPGFFMKYWNKANPGVKWVMGCHLIAPNPIQGYSLKGNKLSLMNIYHFLIQQIVLFLAKCFADTVLVSNTLDKTTLIEKKGFDKDRLLVTYGGVNFEEIDKVADAEKRYDSIFIGRLHPQKGIDDLIQAWEKVCVEKNDAKLLILGRAETFSGIKESFDQLGLLDNIEFGGYLFGEEKYAAIKASRTLVFPSHYESFGMVALEGLACGVPVIAYDLEIYKEIFEQHLITVPVDDITGLAQAILENLSQHKNLKYINDLRTFGRKFDFRTTAESILGSLFGPTFNN